MRSLSLSGSLCLVIGASGGIGSAVCASLAGEGARLIGVARRPASVSEAFQALGIPGRALRGDLTKAGEIASLVEALARDGELPDHVVVAAGYDARKPFEDHDDADIERSVSANFTSLVALCRTAYPRFLARGSGTVTYVGGFGDGTIAFPFYTLDAATRAASAKFLESLNREVPRPSGVRFLYFGPTAVATRAEEEYLPLWRKMGTAVVSPDRVARELVRALRAGKTSVPMGGALTRVGIALNALSPRVADAVFMEGWRKILESHFRPAPEAAGRGGAR